MRGGQTVGKCAVAAGSKAVDDALFAAEGKPEDCSATGAATARTAALERCAVELAAQVGQRRVHARAVGAADESVENGLRAARSDRKDRSAAVAAAARTAAVDGRTVERSIDGDQVRFRIVSVVATRETVHDVFRTRGADAKNAPLAVRAAAAGVAIERAVKRGEPGERPEPVAVVAAFEIVDDVFRPGGADREDRSASQEAAAAVRRSLERRAIDRSVE